MANEKTFKVQQFPGGDVKYVSTTEEEPTVEFIVEQAGFDVSAYTKSVSGETLENDDVPEAGASIILTKKVKGGLR
jgi:hypothetical protein